MQIRLGYAVNIDMDYGRYGSDRIASQPNIYFNGLETAIIRQNPTSQDTPIDISIVTFKTRLLNKNLFKGDLGLGVKISYVDTDNTFDFFNGINDEAVFDPTQSNVFRYTEQINAAYINYNYKKNKWNFQVGLRVENTISDGNLESQQEGDNARVERKLYRFLSFWWI